MSKKSTDLDCFDFMLKSIEQDPRTSWGRVQLISFLKERYIYWLVNKLKDQNNETNN